MVKPVRVQFKITSNNTKLALLLQVDTVQLHAICFRLQVTLSLDTLDNLVYENF